MKDEGQRKRKGERTKNEQEKRESLLLFSSFVINRKEKEEMGSSVSREREVKVKVKVIYSELLIKCIKHNKLHGVAWLKKHLT